MKKIKKNKAYFFTFCLALIIILNILSSRYSLRLDFTANKRYTLSKATKDMIRQLPKTVVLTAYFTKDLPPELSGIRREYKDMLTEYRQISKGKVVFEVRDPSASTADEEKALAAGIQPLVADSREKDQIKKQKVYFGIVVQMGDKSEVIPYLQPDGSLEYLLSSGIKKVSMTNKTKVGFLQGHGEPPLQAFQQVMAQLDVLYDVVPLALSDSTDELKGFNTLIIDAPTDSFPASQLDQLNSFLDKGGKLFLGLNKVDAARDAPQAISINTGLEAWLKQKGIIIEDKFIIDAACGSIQLPPQVGFGALAFPYFPVISKFTNHPVTKGFESLELIFCSPLMVIPTPGIEFTELATSSQRSGTQNPPFTFDLMRQWKDDEFPSSGYTVAGLFKGKGKSGNNWELIVITDGDFAKNGVGNEAQEVRPDNASFMANAVDWLTDKSGLMELRTKEVTDRPLVPLTESRKQLVKYLNFLLPIILVIGYGIHRMQRNRRIRTRRMLTNTSLIP